MTETTKKCPYCAEEVHAEAIKCKHCGEFLKKGDNFESEHATTIQMTGKRWKRLRMIGAGILFAGAMLFSFVLKSVGAVVMLAGLAVICASHIGAFWYHG